MGQSAEMIDRFAAILAEGGLAKTEMDGGPARSEAACHRNALPCSVCPEEMSTEPSFLEGLCDCDERLGRETSRIRAWVSPS